MLEPVGTLSCQWKQDKISSCILCSAYFLSPEICYHLLEIMIAVRLFSQIRQIHLHSLRIRLLNKLHTYSTYLLHTYSFGIKVSSGLKRRQRTTRVRVDRSHSTVTHECQGYFAVQTCLMSGVNMLGH